MSTSPLPSFRPGETWLDTSGQPIQAHGGGVLCADGLYYWFGENKDAPNVPGSTRVDVIGMSCYSSPDLLNWKNEGIVLPAVPGDPAHDLYPGKVAERPKVLYNAATRQYVMWLHVDSPDYTMAAVGVAVSDRATGPYRYLGSVRPNGCDSRDMTVFQDGDGRAYLVHSSDWNSVIMIADLTDDYLRPTGRYTRHFDHGQKNTGRESPALFKHEGKYFIITSGTTGWHPNAAQYAVADALHGPWTVKGNPCVGEGADLTFRAQNTFVLPMPGGAPGDFILLADRWMPDNLQDSRYVWLPMRVRGGQLTVEWHDAWTLPGAPRCEPVAVSPLAPDNTRLSPDHQALLDGSRDCGPASGGPAIRKSAPKGLYIMDPGSMSVVYGEEERRDLQAIVDFYAGPQTPQSVGGQLELLADAEVILTSWGAPLMDKTFLDAAPKLRAVFHGAGSIRSFTTPEFWERGILVTSAAEANAIPVAEYTAAAILLALRGFWKYAALTRAGLGWGDHTRQIAGAYGSTVGLVSCGAIASKVVARLAGSDVRCLAYDPFVSDGQAAALGVELCPLAELFRRADVVSLHTPELPETIGMITGELFESMKPGATFINTARGPLVREAEMVEVLRRRTDLWAVLDVCDPEPAPPNAPLLDLPNIILTPHIAGSMGPECRRLGRYMVDEVSRYVAGEPLRWQVGGTQAGRLA